MWIATAEHCKSLDHRATEEFGIPVRVLMERAGLAVFGAVRDLLPEGGRLSVLCGKGNNGGDGFVVARLAREQGFSVDCLVAAEENQLTKDAAEQMRVTRAQGVEPIFMSDARYRRKMDGLQCKDLIVDALLGTGAQGEVHGEIRDAIQHINRSGVPVLAVDIPSGISCDTGEELGESVWALRTVTFGLPKPFLFQGTGIEHAGFWTIADIGFPNVLLTEPTEARLIHREWVASLLPERLRASHKGQNGSVLIVAGSARMPGAATLAARSALRSGAGLVTVAGVEEVCRAVASHVPEATLMPLASHQGVLSPLAADTILEAQSRYHSALFGPGITHEDPVKEFLERVWQGWERPCVLDADALNAMSLGVEGPVGPGVMTPHPGEMSRLLHRSIAEIQADRFHTIRHAVKMFDKTVLLKGPFSIVGEHDMPMLVNGTGNPGMASAGMGDVLSGVISTLLAQDLDPYYAAACAMYWHGMAGDVCAEQVGTIGYTASEVADALPKARATITKECGASHCYRS